MESQTASFGLCEFVYENMANAARVHAVENGEDLSEYTMIAFGGAMVLIMVFKPKGILANRKPTITLREHDSKWVKHY